MCFLHFVPSIFLPTRVFFAEEAKLKDRSLFSPVPLEKAFNRKRKAETQQKPQQPGEVLRPLFGGFNGDIWMIRQSLQGFDHHSDGVWRGNGSLTIIPGIQPSLIYPLCIIVTLTIIEASPWKNMVHGEFISWSLSRWWYSYDGRWFDLFWGNANQYIDASRLVIYHNF